MGKDITGKNTNDTLDNHFDKKRRQVLKGLAAAGITGLAASYGMSPAFA